MIVPKHRHSDWIFSTHSGHLQLLLSSPGISRLILIGVSLKPLFLALSPKSKSCFKHGIPEIPILSYQDSLISSLVLEKCVGCLVGEMVVEDVEIDSGGEVSKREFRRHLRFERMPYVIQTEVRMVPKMGFGLDKLSLG
ncbi:hypothetical protein RchiOBHm_Chr1g0335101 [Rosa chinensis]|uniref:Uncharacterized protein n=1 Tax=Rosa chinensis TaxID=74649 RepID=A0A2P6SCG9_ROSCH|nr:hypothetical protein RchiOBHm_Chr1g0335101 [Rosa chinensis]